MNENVKNFIDAVNSQNFADAKTEFQAAMANKVNDAFENKKVEIASQMAEGTQINEGSYTVPWDKDFKRDAKKWEKKYNVRIKADRDFNQADVSGKDSDIKKFLSKELDFEEPEFEMIGLDEAVGDSQTEILDEKMSRQLKDPKKETMVVKDGKVEVIDKKDVDKYMKKGYELAEESEDA